MRELAGAFREKGTSGEKTGTKMKICGCHSGPKGTERDTAFCSASGMRRASLLLRQGQSMPKRDLDSTAILR